MTEPQPYETITCPRCGAPPGQPCTWRVRRPSGHVHLARVDAVLRAIDEQRRKAG